MKDVTNANFGLLIAYVLPGFVTLWGIGQFSPTVQSWLGGSSEQSPTVGGFLYVTLAAVAAGLLISTIRWAVIDRIHHRTGIREPQWDFATLNGKLAAFDLLVSSHYRYYQWHANMLVAVAFTFSAFAISEDWRGSRTTLMGLSFVLFEILLWLGSRDTLRKYYVRAEALMGTTFEESPAARRTGLSSVMRNRGLKIEGPFR